MKVYREFQPTGFDTKGLNADMHGIGNMYVVLGRNRNSGVLERSNFECALRALGGEDDEHVQVHRVGHWANGWFELLLVDETRHAIAQNIEAALENYPVLDDSHFSELQYTETCEYWAQCSVRERVEYLQRAHQCIFAARRDELPADDTGRLFELLTRN